MIDQLPGKPYPTDETDQECDHCGFWFDNAGIGTHEEHCLVKTDPTLSFDGSRLVARKCPDCGGWCGVHLAGCTYGLGEEFSEEDGEIQRRPIL